MINTKVLVGTLLKEHRLKRQLSQQELAEQSGVSLRTIQRIESGSSNGSPYTMRMLCSTLGIIPEDLIANPASRKKEEIIPKSELTTIINPASIAYNSRIKYMNISSFCVLFFPFLNLVVPTVLYIIFRKSFSSNHDKTAALKILSLQILWSVITLIAIIFIPVADLYIFKIGHVMEIPLFVWGYLVSIIGLLLITLKTASDINNVKPLLVFIPNIL